MDWTYTVHSALYSKASARKNAVIFAWNCLYNRTVFRAMEYIVLRDNKKLHCVYRTQKTITIDSQRMHYECVTIPVWS